MQSSIHPAPSSALPRSAPTGERAWGDLARNLLRLTKPRVTSLVLVTTACGAHVAPGPARPVRLIVTLLGVALVVGSANAFNMYLERDSDRAMQRTRLRPLPAGQLRPELAFWFASSLALIGLVGLTVLVNSLTALLTALAFGAYVLLYTPLKRVTPWALHVGAIPGAMPPLIGWASVSGSVNFAAFTLFAMLFVWQLPHFLAIAIFRQSEYEMAGLRVLPAVKGLAATKREIFGYLLLMMAVSLLPVYAGLAGFLYLSLALVWSSVFAAWGLYGLGRQAGARWARSLFFVSMPYLILVFGALVLAPA